MKKLFLLLFSVLAFTSQVRADVEWSIWEGENTNDVYIPDDLVAKMEVGDKIFVSFKQTDGDQDGELLIGWNTIAYKMGEGYADYFDYTNNIVTITITETLKNQVAGTAAYTKYYWDDEWKTEEVTQAGDLRIKANGSLKFTRIVLQKQKSFIVKSYDVTASIGNYSGGINVYPQGLTSDDYLYFDATTGSAEYWQAQLGGLGTINVVGGFWFPVTTYYNTLNTNGAYLNGRYINVTGMKQYHPVNSFKIGSIGMATFSADQKVTVPEGLTAYKAAVSGNNVTLTPFTNNVIPANTGAIIEGPQGSVVEFVASNNGSTEESALQPVTTATDVTTLDKNYDYYVLYEGTGEKKDPLALSTLLSDIQNWGGSVNVSTEEPYTAEWTSSSSSSSMGKWIGTNWSSYDKLRLVFTENTVADNVHFGISYSGQGDTENTGAELAQNQLTVDIPLNPSYKSAIENFSFNSNATSGKLTFASAALIDSDGATVAEFRKTTSGTLAANKAYLKLEAASLARLSIVFNDDDSETTGVLDVQKHTTQSDNVYYNLRGMQVDKPTKGLYIMNGKKVIVK